MSNEVGSVKPDPGILPHGLELQHAAPEVTLMLCDSWQEDSGSSP
ncbi:hypothetical protein [Ornithinimicrobium cavernae]|nr:hypothetical protein [Ornithinimicrobium cavernae]